MYLEHYGLSDFPFSTAPDPRFYYPSAKHREALACLLYSIQQRKGFALVSGDVGAGKTMLCRACLEQLGDACESATVCHTSLEPREFLESVVAEFGLEPWRKSKPEMLHQFKDFLEDRRKRGITVVLIVDEAQNLLPPVLEEVRMLGNLETSSEKLLQVILVGQPELRRIVNSYELRQLNQRIALKFHLGPLAAKDGTAYIDHRLKVAGADGRQIIEPEAKTEAYRAGHGIPRVINAVCDQALLQGFINDENVVTLAALQQVLADREGYYMDEPVEPTERVDPEKIRRDMRKARMRCPRCKTAISVYEDDIGRSGNCPGCGVPIRVPANVFSDGDPAQKVQEVAGISESEHSAQTGSNAR